MTEGMAAEGYTGTVDLAEGTATITHNWRGRVHGGKAPRVIDLSAVQRVDFQPAALMTNGHIRFAVPGETHETTTMDKNCVIFTRKQQPAFEAIRDKAVAALNDRSSTQLADVEAAVADAAAEASAARRKTMVATYDKHKVIGGFYRSGLLAGGKDVAGATAVFESGADRSRPTLTRIGAGAIIAGPVGAIAGGLFKKNKSKCYITIEFPDGQAAIIEGPAKDETKMRKFAATLNTIAAS